MSCASSCAGHGNHCWRRGCLVGADALMLGYMRGVTAMAAGRAGVWWPDQWWSRLVLAMSNAAIMHQELPSHMAQVAA